MSENAFIESRDEMRAFVLASTGKKGSNTLFTLTNLNTGNHCTFLVRKKDPNTPIWFVRYLSGSDNTRDYSYLGMIDGAHSAVRFVRTRKSPSADCMSFKVFNWFFNKVLNGTGRLPTGLRFNHHGHCCACGRLLTVGESVRRGWGPKCAQREAA